MHKRHWFKVKATIRGLRSSLFFSITEKTSEASVIKLLANVNSNKMVCFIRIKVLLPKVRITVSVQRLNHGSDLTQNR